MDVAILEVMSFGGYDLGDYELLGISDFGGIALWRQGPIIPLEVAILEVASFGGYGLGVFNTHPLRGALTQRQITSALYCFLDLNRDVVT